MEIFLFLENFWGFYFLGYSWGYSGGVQVGIVPPRGQLVQGWQAGRIAGRRPRFSRCPVSIFGAVSLLPRIAGPINGGSGTVGEGLTAGAVRGRSYQAGRRTDSTKKPDGGKDPRRKAAPGAGGSLGSVSLAVNGGNIARAAAGIPSGVLSVSFAYSKKILKKI